MHSLMKPRNMHWIGRKGGVSLTKCLANYHEFPLPASVSKDAPPRVGYNYILHRAANITLNLFEKRVAKLLHIFPDNAFPAYLGRDNHLEVNGFSDSSAQLKDIGYVRCLVAFPPLFPLI